MTRQKQSCKKCGFSVAPLYFRRNAKFEPLTKEIKDETDFCRDNYHLRAYHCWHCGEITWLREYGKYRGL